MTLVPKIRMIPPGDEEPLPANIIQSIVETTINEIEHNYDFSVHKAHFNYWLQIPTGTDMFKDEDVPFQHTFYPDADPESTSVDGYASHSETAPGVTWTAMVGSAGVEGVDDGTGKMLVHIQSDIATQNRWRELRRGIILFDTSTLPPEGTITDAVFSIYISNKVDELGITPDINIYTSAPASNTALEAGDFDSLGDTPLCDTALTYATATTGQYHNFTLNTAGLAVISKTGITKLGVRNANYDVAISAPDWTANSSSGIYAYLADDGVAPPKLLVNFTLPLDGFIWIE